MSREALHPVDHAFLDRWSPRSFTDAPVGEAALHSMVEAARWAPSCFNAQPWHIVVAHTEEGLATVRGLLVPFNLMWAGKAPALMVIFARRTFERNDEPNRHHAFDAGAAWMSLALEGRRHGLHTHGMAGFDLAGAPAACGLDPALYEAMAVIAVGHIGPRSALPEPLQEREIPSDRKAPEEMSSWL